MQYRPNEPDVVSEILDGEAVVIHLQSGTYYSLRDAALDVWQGLAAGWTADDIAACLADDAGVARESVAEPVADFVAQLVAEELVVPYATAGRDAARPFAPRGVFAAPQLQKFTDMQEMLLIDPIHEVTEAGWPIKNPKAE
ncbi:hypothetical protein DK847_13150 [Aestuariivirga litoralis]|uniref:PqqD family protein n=1 Tax=Aestuariivirga litoralis TaxID=2650924 RepID=A0A2W2AR79_9HYPH|nr:PqqD family protein [Aestuariivirga litoralis]PZF76152.1 hypothetical protein DK847_13150 [Aestuariivirga litoralis]